VRVLVLIASHMESGEPSALRQGDRAAVHWGMTWAGASCQVRFPPGDSAAWNYTAAVGATGAVWDDGPLSTPDLVLIGSGAVDAYGDILAGHLILLVDGPIVLVVSDQAERPPYVSRFRLEMAARSLPELSATPSLPTIATQWQPVMPRAPRATGRTDLDTERRANLVFGIDLRSGNSAGKQVISEEPGVCAQLLLRYLVHHGLISRTLPKDSTIPIAGPLQDDRADPIVTNVKPPTSGLPVAIRRGPRQRGRADCGMVRRPRLAPSSGIHSTGMKEG
jgi:hypothetical protein